MPKQVQHAPSGWVAVLPNLLSVLRLALAAAFPFLPPTWRLTVVAVAGGSDWLDGVLARRLGVSSTAGMLLDGAADKLFVLSVLLTLILRGVIAWWTLPLVLARDLVVAFVAVFAVIIREWSRFRQLRPRGPGKATTVLVFAWFIAVLAPFPWLDPLRPILLVMAAGCSMLAAIDYLILFQRALREWLVSRKKGQRDRTEGQRD